MSPLPRFLMIGVLAVVLGALSSIASRADLTATFVTDADTFTAQEWPNSNFGSYQWLTMRTALTQGRTTFIRFPVQGVSGTVTSATLQVHARQAGWNIGAWYLPNALWSESSVTWANQPIAGAVLIQDGISVVTGQTLNVDVTPYVSGNQPVAFGFATNDDAYYRFDSRETSFPPKLVVTYNTFPVAVNDSASTTVGQPVVIDLLANDFDPDGDDPVLLPAAQQPWQNVLATCNCTIEQLTGAQAGSVRFTPLAGFTPGIFQFNYTIHDGNGHSDTATVSVDVDPAPQSCDWTQALEIMKEVGRAFRGDPEVCAWQNHLDNDFSAWITGGSHNLPVMAAAIALFRGENVGVNLLTWWDDYLSSELGQIPPQGSLGYFGGGEQGSFIYQHYNLLTVLAVRSWARENGQTALQQKARQWLRVSMAVMGLSASDRGFTSLVKNDPASPIHSTGGGLGSGFTVPWAALAGDRSKQANWTASKTRSAVLARALGLSPNNIGENGDLKALREEFEAHWNSLPNPPTYGFYGLTGSESSQLRFFVQAGNHVVPPGFVNQSLSGIRTKRRWHFLRWNDGTVATLMEGHATTFTVPTLGVVYYRGNDQAHFLHPWVTDPSTQPGIGHACARFDDVNGYLIAHHAQRNETVWLDLPSATPDLHIIVGSSPQSATGRCSTSITVP